METSGSLLGPLEGEQQSLPGTEHLAPRQPPLMAAVTEEVEATWPLRPARPGPGQLNLTSEQMELEQVEPQPVQLQLLDEPPPWETPQVSPAPKDKTGRLAKKRSRKGITPGQASLF